MGRTFSEAAATPEPTPPVEPTPEPTTDEFLNDLAARGAAPVDERIQAKINEAAQNLIAPIMTTMVETTHAGLLQTQKATVDSEWGPGTFDEVIMPDLAKELTQLRQLNFRALADTASIKALVDRHIGINYKTLKTRDTEYTEAKTKEAQQVRDDLITSLPTGGQPRISLREGEVDQDTQLFFKELHAATGETVDTKKFDSMRKVDSLADYLKLTAGSQQ